MKHIFISDLHLNTYSDNTNPDIIDFIVEFYYRNRDLEKQYKETEQLWIVGDMYEGLQNTEKDFQDQYFKIREYWKPLFRYLDKIDYRIIGGNHDREFLKYNRIKYANYVYIRLKDMKYYVTHGDMFDPISYQKGNIITRAINYYGKVEKYIKEIEKKYGVVMGDNPNPSLFEQYYLDIIDDKAKELISADFGIIMGHTHRVEIKNDYINTGCWVNGHSDYIILDDAWGDIDRYEW